MTAKSQQKGVSLIEVLVAAVIIAIGLLGLAGLQTRSLQMNQSAHYRSQANYYAYQMVDAMRMNKEAAEAGKYDIAMGNGPPSSTSVPKEALHNWKKGIRAALPMGSEANTGGSVAVTDGPDATTAQITVAWVDERWSESEDDKVRSITVRTEL